MLPRMALDSLSGYDTITDFLYSKEDLDRLDKIIQNNKALELCDTGWLVYKVTHKPSGVSTMAWKPNFCTDRRCTNPGCIKHRQTMVRLHSSKKSPSLNSTFKAIKKLKVTHLIGTFRAVPKTEMTREKLKDIRRTIRSFQKKLLRSKYPYWGFYVLEIRYHPAGEYYTPHVHFCNFGFVQQQEVLRGWWAKLLGQDPNKTIFKTEYSRSKWAMLDYFSYRCATSGLITGKNREILGQIPQDDYVDLVKGSRLFNRYGVFPQGVLALTGIIETEYRDKLADFEVTFLGKIPKSKYDTIPPPNIPSIKDLEARFEQLQACGEDEILSERFLLFKAFQELQEEALEVVSTPGFSQNLGVFG